MRPSSAHSYIREGMIPFFRLPRLEASADPAGLDVALLGVPWDGGVTYRPGARFAPYEVRRVSALVQGFHPGHGVDVFDALQVADAGNVAIPPFDAEGVRAAIEADVARLVEAGVRPFVVGGDHSITLPVLRALARQRGPVALVQVDAHLDTSTAALWGSEFHHGTVVRNACDEGLIAAGALHQVGIRASWGAPEDGDYALAFGGVIHYADSVMDRGVDLLAASIREALVGRPVYLSIDVDGVDPAYAPGTGMPVPGGLTSRELLRLLRGLRGLDIAGMDVVEICPALDHADITAHLGATLLHEGLALVAAGARGP